ncbi:uncharacterized protein BX663DRAFT_441511 [Cokeromyces recurvatus]|uniref:uncharacterized protein n=1 Tax=Cokeromyces recurvatus TaxID=90255 RepID=UPI00221FDE09|nr:uncharacterized protein BX663DRAFT_441511 [Cokeromyces recurvatus]KAI7899349.1 hypothetical protein BX663DRAFT_441511 [Cokeromyces recurvatus]
MGAKRAVEGRSQPYDVLLAAYQKKSIGRPNVKDQLAKKKVNQTNDESFIDSDEEVENVMQAFKQSRPTPLAEKRYYFVKRRRQCFRLRDILVDAITPKLNNTYSQRQQQQQQQQQQQNNFNTDNNTIFNEPSNTTFFSVR